MADRRRPDAEQLLRMAEHRRSMQALRKVSTSAAQVATQTAARHLHVVAVEHELAPDDTTVVSLAAERARRAGHPAGANLRP